MYVPNVQFLNYVKLIINLYHILSNYNLEKRVLNLIPDTLVKKK